MPAGANVWNTNLGKMTRRSAHRKGTPEKMCHESAVKHITEENKVIKTRNI